MTEDDGATEYWLYDGQRHYKVGLNAVVGKPLHQRTFDPARFDEMRRGAYDIHARCTTWTSTACTPRCASRRRSPASPGSATSSA